MTREYLPVLELNGDEVDEFLKYDQRPLTSAEIKSLKEADAFYKEQSLKAQSLGLD